MPLRDRARAARRHLDRYLFPEPVPVGIGLSRAKVALLAVTLLGAAVLLQLARIGWTGSLDALWAEDGSILLQGAVTHGAGSMLFSEYAGYLIFIPRLIGEIVTVVPLRAAPGAFSVLSALVAALSGLAVWHASSGHIENPYLRGILAGLTVLTPIGGLETIDSASYTSWYMLFAVFWLLLWRPRTAAGAGLGAVFILLTGLSTPGVWFLAPLALLRAFAIRDRRDLAIVLSWAVGAVVQFYAVATSSAEQVTPAWTKDVWTVLLQRVVDGTAFGLRLGGEAWVHFGWTFLAALTVAGVLGMGVGLWKTSRSVRYLAALAIPIALTMFIVAIYQRAVATPMAWPSDGWNGDAGRYSLVPVMLLVSVILAMVDRSWRGREWRERPWTGIAVVSVLLVSGLISLPARNLAGRGTPPWSASLGAADTTCSASPEGASTLQISPPGFAMELPCSKVLDSSDADPRR
jgi:hypothetical protein